MKGNLAIADEKDCPSGFPFPDWYKRENEYLYPIEETDIMADLKERLIIEWGKATTAWFQWGTNEKEVVSIQLAQKIEFPGFDKLILSYDKLKEIIDNPILYDNWHTTMASVNAIYLIVDKIDGQQYVGSASNTNGLLGRWSEYAKTGHGGNTKMKEKLKNNPDRCHDFQFSVLQILPQTMMDDRNIEKIESLWKSKLLSRSFGMNDN